MTHRSPRLGLVLIAAGLLSGVATSQTVDGVEIVVKRANPADGPEPNPYQFEVAIRGTGIFSATVEAKNGTAGPIPVPAQPDPGAFSLGNHYPNLPALRQDWPTGDYQLNLNDGALLLDLIHAPVEPLQASDVLWPLDGDLCVPLPMVVQWANCLGCGGSNLYVELDSADGDAVQEILPPGQTLWAPPIGYLQPGTEYSGLVLVVDLDQQVTLPGGGLYLSAFVLDNRFEFRTAFEAMEWGVAGVPPNPNALLPGILGPPLLGRTWSPRIDHSFFAPAAAFDVLALDLRDPINLVRPFGTLLIQPPPSSQLFMATPGTPFQLPIPPDCQLAGMRAMSQGLSFTPGQGIELTNGLLIQLGTQ